MFELIRILVEQVVARISIGDIAERKRRKKLAIIGSEMVLLFNGLNGLIVVGHRILELLGEIAESPKATGMHSFWGDQLKKLVRFQAERLVNVITSCQRLSAELGVIDETGGRVLMTLLDIKAGILRNQIFELWPEMWHPHSGANQLLDWQDGLFLRSFNAEALQELITSSNCFVEREVSEKVWNSGVQIPLDGAAHSELAQKFLDSGALKNLEEITEKVQKLREQIVKHFSITDILLKVRDERAFSADPDKMEGL